MPFVLNLLRETPTKAKCAARESNPGRKNGNLTCYHYTSGADADARIYRFITVHRKSYSSLRVDDGWNRWCGYWVKEKQIIAYFITCFKLPPSFVFFLTHWNDSTVKMYSSLRTRVRTLLGKIELFKSVIFLFPFPPNVDSRGADVSRELLWWLVIVFYVTQTPSKPIFLLPRTFRSPCLASLFFPHVFHFLIEYSDLSCLIKLERVAVALTCRQLSHVTFWLMVFLSLQSTLSRLASFSSAICMQAHFHWEIPFFLGISHAPHSAHIRRSNWLHV